MKKIIYSMLMLAAMLSFTACEDVPMPYDMPSAASETDEPEPLLVGDGTAASPYSVASALYLIKEGKITEDNVYVEGIISKIDEIDTTTKFGNATYYISDDGTTANHLEVYRGYSLGGAKFKSDTEIKVGDKVIVYGQLVYFNQKTPEFTQGNYIYSLNGVTAGGGEAGEAKGTGTKDDPFNVAAAIAKCKDIGTTASTDKYYVKGIAQEDATADATYNNITVDIADTEGGAKFKCYQVAGTDGKPLPKGFSVKKGDEVVVFGPIYNYSGNTPETAGKSAAYIVSVNGKATGEGGGGGETPSTDAKKVTVAEFNAAEVNENVWYQLTGTVENLKDGDQYGNFDLKDETGSVYVYGLLSEKGGEKKKFQDLAAAKGIKNGSKITIIGTRGVFNDKIEVMNAYFVSIEGGGSSSEQGGGSSDEASSGDNGTFESWSDNIPTNWKTTSTAGNATLSQSSDAHGGSYSVKVGGISSANKRLGYKELQLKAGSYTLKFYAKAATSTGASVRPGYVPVTNGAVGSYTYGDYVNDITNSSWVEVTHTFDLTSDGVYSIVIMNSKNPGGDVLIDDLTLKMGNNTIIK